MSPLIFADQFLQISTSLPSKFLYGLGEHRDRFLHSLDWNTLTLWARDVPPTVHLSSSCRGTGVRAGVPLSCALDKPWESMAGVGSSTGRVWGWLRLMNRYVPGRISEQLQNPLGAPRALGVSAPPCSSCNVLW